MLRQRDTYFRVAAGPAEAARGGARRGDLIAYERPDDRRRARLGLPARARSPTRTALRAALTATRRDRVVVDKERRLLLWEGSVRIHLDDVDGPGLVRRAGGGRRARLGPRRASTTRSRGSATRSGSATTRCVEGSYADAVARPGAPDPELRGAGARRPSGHAYAPYSNFPVGAAVRTDRRPPLRGRQRRERRLPAGAVRGGVGDRRDRGRRRRADRRGRGGRAERGAVHAVRRLPPAAARVRAARRADPPRRPRARPPHDVARRAAAAVVRPGAASPDDARAAHERSRSARPGFTPRLGLVLGSGLGALVDELDGPRSRSPTPTSPGFRVGTVAGHAGALVARPARRAGRVASSPGRSHVYEGIEAERDHHAGADAARRSAPRCSCSPTRPARCAPRPGRAASSRCPTTSTCTASTRSSARTTTASARASRASRGAYDPELRDAPARRRRRARHRAARRRLPRGQPARASRRRPRSAPSARWAPTSSG